MGLDVFNCIVSQERTYDKIKCCLSLIVYNTRRVENTHQPKKVEARSVLLQDSLLGDNAVNAGIQCRVPSAEWIVSEPTGGTKTTSPGRAQAGSAHYPSLPHRTVLGLGFRVHGMGKGVLFKMKGADGRGKFRHHSMQTADFILQVVSWSLRAAAGGTGLWGRRMFAVKSN